MIDNFGKYLEFWPLLIFGPILIIQFIRRISYDIRHRGSLSNGTLAIIAIILYAALCLGTMMSLVLFGHILDERTVTEEEAFRLAVWRWAACLFVFLHFLTVFLRWRKIGNSKNVLSFPVTKFEIPKQISPTASIYLIRQGDVDHNRLLITVLFSLICNGLLLIKGSTIQRSEKEVGDISNDELFFLKALGLESKGSIFEIEENSERWAARMRSFKDILVDHLDDEIFDFMTHNVKQIRRDMLVTTMLLVFFTLGSIWGFAWFLIIPPVFIALFRSNKVIKYILGCIFLFAVLTATVDFPSQLFLLPWILVGTLSIITLLMIVELRNFSVEGAKIVDHLRGLDLFMSARKHSSVVGAPTPSLEQFLVIFPYALAMQSHETWIKKFENELSVWQSTSENRQLSMDDESNALSLSAIINYANFENFFYDALNFSLPPVNQGSE